MTMRCTRHMTAQRLCFSSQLYILTVIKMKRIKPLKKGSLTGKILRLLGPNRGFEEPSNDQEEITPVGIPANNYYINRKEIETALLEAEQKKAKALMEWQRRRFIC